MPSIHKTYTKDVYEQLKYRPTWLPGTPTKLGTVGVIEDGIFRPVTDLKKLGIAFSTTKDPVSDGALDFMSATGVTIDFKAAGEVNARFRALATAEAGAVVEFGRERAVVLQLKGVSINRVADQAALGRSLLQAITIYDESKSWQRDWVAITHVVEAESATILISGSSTSRVELKASGTAAPSSLADASADLKVASESQVSTKIIAESGLSPLYNGLRVGRRFWSLYDEILPASAEAPDPREVFTEADPSDDLDPIEDSD